MCVITDSRFCSTLAMLDVSDNRLTVLPDHMTDFPNLYELYIFQNPLLKSDALIKFGNFNYSQMNDEGLDTRDLILALELPNASLITSYNDFNFSGNEIGAMGIFQAFHIVNFFDGFPEWRNLTFDFNMNGLTSEQSILDALFMRIEWGRVSHFMQTIILLLGQYRLIYQARIQWRV